MLQGPGSMAFTGKTFLFNSPRTGALLNEFRADGEAVRSIGRLRSTGHEAEPAVHAALNTGLPLIDPTGGFYFVFQTGTPMFRKYDSAGALLFERHVEGIELDQALRSLPNAWPVRTLEEDARPFAPALIQTAAVDRTGRLWISLAVGYTYVFDRSGDKIRTVQFQAAGPLSPISLFFARNNRLLVTPGCYEFPGQ